MDHSIRVVESQYSIELRSETSNSNSELSSWTREVALFFPLGSAIIDSVPLGPACIDSVCLGSVSSACVSSAGSP